MGKSATATADPPARHTAPAQTELRAVSDDDSAFEDWLARADEEMLVCRDLGHWWPRYSDKETRFQRSRTTQDVYVDQPCLRDCGVTRTRVLGPHGELSGSSNSYSYPENYQFKTPGGTPGVNVGKERKARIRETLLNAVKPSRFEMVD